MTDEEWAFLAPCLALAREDSPRREHPLREPLDGLRRIARSGAPWRMTPRDLPPWRAVCRQARRWTAAGCFEQAAHDLRELVRLKEGRRASPAAAILDGRVLRGAPESGHRAGCSGHKRAKGSQVHLAADALGRLLALVVTPASVDERKAVAERARRVQEATGSSVELARGDQGYTVEAVAQAAAEHGTRLEAVKLDEAKKGFVLLPGRWVVERSFAWSARFKRLAEDYERLPEVPGGMRAVAFCTLMLKALAPWLQGA